MSHQSKVERSDERHTVLARSIQEIEATRFDQEGKTLAPNGQFEVEGGGGEEDDDDEDGEQDENSPHNAKAALESSLSSIGSPSPSLKSLPSPDQVIISDDNRE